MLPHFSVAICDLAQDGRIEIQIDIDGGTQSFFPTLDRFAEGCEKGDTIGDPLTWFLQLDPATRREKAKGYVQGIVGMESKVAYAKGYCANEGPAAAEVRHPEVITSCPEDEAKDSEHLTRPVRSTETIRTNYC